MLKELENEKAYNPIGKVIRVFEDEWHSISAVTKHENKYYLGKSDANWRYRQLGVKDDMFRAPWPMSEDEARKIREILKKEGVVK